MPHFKEVLAATLAHEGGYVNDPFDRGGETYRGISRKYHPNWPGWTRIDQRVYSHAKLEADPVLIAAVEEFYRAYYWAPIGGEDIDDRALAGALFDCAVNLGVKKAVWFLQRALNALSKGGALSGHVVPDRVWGRATARALRAQLAANGSAAIVMFITGMRTVHYLNLIEHDPRQGRFAHGWMARVGPLV